MLNDKGFKNVPTNSKINRNLPTLMQSTHNALKHHCLQMNSVLY